MLDLSDREDLRGAARLISAVQQIVPPEDLLVVGAAARDWLLKHAHGIRVDRATLDVDLAIEVGDWTAFDRTRTGLMQRCGFTAVPGILHRMSHSEFGLLDLVPFGAIEEVDGSLRWPPPMESSMNMLGFTEAAESAVHVNLPESVTANVTSLPMLAVLKLLSWEDRRRRKPRTDAPDLFLILRNYEQAGNENRIYEEFSDFLHDEKYDEDRFSAWLAGHDARVLLDRLAPASKRLHDLIFSILTREAQLDGSLELVIDGGGAREYSRQLGLLKNFFHGLQGVDSLTE